MTKISLIGAGSVVFTRNLCSDILLVPELQDCTISLMDIDSERLKMAQALGDAAALRAAGRRVIQFLVENVEDLEYFGR